MEKNIYNYAEEKDSKEIVRVHIETWKTTYRKFFEEEVFVKLENDKEKREKLIRESIRNGAKFFVCRNSENKIVGFINYGKERNGNKGEIYSIYILKDYQKQGIGTFLIKKAFEELKGYKRIIIKCLKENSSKNFYKKLGGKVIGEEKSKVGDKEIIESIFEYIV